MFELRPYHVARALFVLAMLPVIYTFGIEGVTTTTEYDFSSGASASNNLGAQLGSVAIWIVLAVVCGIAEWYLRSHRTEWPARVRTALANFNVAPRTTRTNAGDISPEPTEFARPD